MTADRDITLDTSVGVSWIALVCVLVIIGGSLVAVHALWPDTFFDVAVWVVVAEVIGLLAAVFIRQARRRRRVQRSGREAIGVVESSEPWLRQGQEGSEDTIGAVVTVVFADHEGRMRRTIQSIEGSLSVGQRVVLRYLPDRIDHRDGVVLVSTRTVS
ncbi:hypothetical protein [Arthrobacter sp. RCC_34]|uniref:hypothetical protein n=1 Tax=Arthrobacter sp. RCC_34 TaxID=3239230 RepID=UPI0035259262